MRTRAPTKRSLAHALAWQYHRPVPIQRNVTSPMQPTSEQQQAIDFFKHGTTLKINAFAGTGKTTTLKMLAQASPRLQGTYLAFNRSIADAAAKDFPRAVTCKTVHSLAYASTDSTYKSNRGKMTERMFGNQVAKVLELDAVPFGREYGTLQSRSLGFLVADTVRNYCQSSSQCIDATHVRMHGMTELLPHDWKRQLSDHVVLKANLLWRRMRDSRDATPLGHDGYLKLWALSKPRIHGDYIFLDEAQDTNPVVLEVVKSQEAQVVFVGDRHQQIYEWRGAVNAMEQVSTAHESYLTRSFRFGPQIAAAASTVLESLGEKRAIEGNPDKESHVGCERPAAIVCRTNASVILAVLNAVDAGRRVCVVGGVGELLRMLEAVTELKANRPADVAEFFGFSSWTEVVAFSRRPEGEYIKTFVNLVERHGETHLQRELKRTSSDELASDLIATTAHKAKGREWSTVALTDDYLIAKDEKGANKLESLDPSELRTLYVAMTRGREAVGVPKRLVSQFGIRENPLIQPSTPDTVAPSISAQTVTPYERTADGGCQVRESEASYGSRQTTSQSPVVPTWFWAVIAALAAYAVFKVSTR
ncbi:MAG: DEAD/DEAH box helicase [Planctomycetes bacterium]|nr:DEAD/DEAH box helicase [Planctomycetota bacterium]